LGGKKKVKPEPLDEGLKDVLLGALMGLSFMTPAKAQKTANALSGNIPAAKVQALAQDIKSADNTADLSSIIKSYSDDTEDIKINKNIAKPSGYKPLTVQQRKDWNEYLHSLGDMAGSPELDKGVPTLGRQKLEDYLKANPSSSLNQFKNQDDLVKCIQYEMQLIRRGSEFPGLTPFELKAMQTLLLKNRKAFMMVNRSETDGNPGQFTTEEHYPEFNNETDYSKVMNNVYRTLVKLYKITNIDGTDITKLVK
jgi:hypothetical protein